MKLNLARLNWIILGTMLIGLGFLSACQKAENRMSPAGAEKNGLEIIWETPIITENWQTALCIRPVLCDSLVVFSTEYNIYGYSKPLLFLDVYDGAVKGGWDDYIAGANSFYGDQVVNNGRYLVLGDNSDVNCIDLQSRTTQWQTDFDGGGPYIYHDNDWVYFPVENRANKKAAIMHCRIEDGVWDTLHSIQSTTRFTPSFDALGFGTLANDDEIVVWKNRAFYNVEGQTDIYAYNLSADTLLWVNTDLNFNSGILALQTDTKRVYGVVHKQVFALDINDGSMIWQRSFEGLVDEPMSANMDVGAMFQTSSAIVLKGDGPELLYLNKKAGSLQRKVIIPDGYQINDGFTYFEGDLYFTTGDGLVIMNLASGSILFNNAGQERFRFQNINTGVTLDTVSRLMYFSNGRHAFCAKIPDLE